MLRCSADGRWPDCWKSMGLLSIPSPEKRVTGEVSLSVSSEELPNCEGNCVRKTHDDIGDLIRFGSYIICLRSEEHTSELQSRGHLVCRLLLEKKKIKTTWL